MPQSETTQVLRRSLGEMWSIAGEASDDDLLTLTHDLERFTLYVSQLRDAQRSRLGRDVVTSMVRDRVTKQLNTDMVRDRPAELSQYVVSFSAASERPAANKPSSTATADEEDGIDGPPILIGGTPGVPFGTFTVQTIDGVYRTIKIEKQPLGHQFAPGRVVASYLNGPDNWKNYKGFAFVNETFGSAHIWKSFQDNADTSFIVQALNVILHGGEGMINGLKAYGHQSKSCGMCGRKLTTPDSLAFGIGPKCRTYMGL